MLQRIYTLLFYLCQPLVILEMWRRSLRQPNYRKRLAERYGFYRNLTAPQPNGIVIHAASVGEVIASTPLIKAILHKYPKLPVTVTTVTPTGSAQVKAALGDKVCHCYLPYDLPLSIQRFFRFVQPKLILVVETELWPNLISQAEKQHIPFIVVNARLSPRSAKRYAYIGDTMRQILRKIRLVIAQDQVSADRFLALGLPPENLFNSGNLKFDLQLNPRLHEMISQQKAALKIASRPVWIAGSTHEGEESLILAAHQRLLQRYPDLVLILVPRHPERFEGVADLVEKSGLAFVRRTRHCALSEKESVLLGDTMGEMMLLYGLANVAFVGGSLVKHGGHNPLEPLAFRLPVISGKHTFNFPEIFAKLREVQGVLEVNSSEKALAEIVAKCLENPSACQAIGDAGFGVLRENQGALTRHLQQLKPFLRGEYDE